MLHPPLRRFYYCTSLSSFIVFSVLVTNTYTYSTVCGLAVVVALAWLRCFQILQEFLKSQIQSCILICIYTEVLATRRQESIVPGRRCWWRTTYTTLRLDLFRFTACEDWWWYISVPYCLSFLLHSIQQNREIVYTCKLMILLVLLSP